MTETTGPQGSPSLDPFEMWRKYYEANEQAWSKAIREVITTPDYAESQGKMLETFLSLQKLMRDGMTTQLNNLNLPTRDDVARSIELVIGVEEKVDQLDEQVSKVEDKVIHLDQRLATLEKLVVQNTERLPALEARFQGIESNLGKKLDEKVAQIAKQLDRLEEQLSRRIEATDRASQVGNGTESVPARTPRAAARPRRVASSGGEATSQKVE